MPDQQDTPQQKTLYVICHGALAILQTEQNLILMIPDMGSKHTYRVGTWLAETTIEKGSSFVLENVIGGSGSVPNLLDRHPGQSTATQRPYATFTFPRPRQVHSLFQCTIPKDTLISAPGSAALTADVIVPYLPILEYGYSITPQLGNVWPVSLDELTGLPDNPLTLHIYAEDEVALDDSHAVDAFNMTCQLLGLDVSLPLPTDENQSPVRPATQVDLPPRGLENRRCEFQPLEQRRKAMLALSKAKQSLGAIVDPWASLQSRDLNALGREFFWPDKNGGDRPDRLSETWNGRACLPVQVGVARKG